MQIKVIYPTCPTCLGPLMYAVRVDNKETLGACPKCGRLYDINEDTVDEALKELQDQMDKSMFYMTKLLTPIEEE